MKWHTMATAVLLISLAGCTDDESDAPRVLFETSLGDFTVELWPDKAPKTVENFLRYVEADHFDGLTFHRISPDFVVQGGGFLPDHQTQRTTRTPIVNEADESVKNEKWTLSMARTNDANSATSQFFINLKDNAALDKRGDSAGYAVFGKVVSGTDTVKAMTEVQPGQSFGNAGGYFPAEPILIHEARIIQGDAPTIAPAALEIDTILQGSFPVSHEEEVIMVWARNDGDLTTTATWNLTGQNGMALPEGWTYSFQDPQQEIGGGGSAVFTMLELDVPPGTGGGFDVELRAGDVVQPIRVQVALTDAAIARAGDEGTIQYRGECVADGKQFDAGQFNTKLGPGGRAIIGFGYGLIGFAEGESGTLVIPSWLAYGDYGGPCAGLETADLLFDVTLTAFS